MGIDTCEIRRDRRQQMLQVERQRTQIRRRDRLIDRVHRPCHVLRKSGNSREIGIHCRPELKKHFAIADRPHEDEAEFWVTQSF
jgi:hypothetical protein